MVRNENKGDKRRQKRGKLEKTREDMYVGGFNNNITLTTLKGKPQ